LIIKTTFKSHFKIQKNKKNKKKFVFLKNMVVFLLFSKIFFKNCCVVLNFLKKKDTQRSFLKAPSRHKKFFHQVFSESFFLKIFFKFIFFKKFNLNNCINVHNNLNNVFKKIGSNIFTRIKYTTTVVVNMQQSLIL